MSDLYLLLGAVIGIASIAALLVISYLKFEWAIFIVAFSSWMPYIFYENSIESIIEEQVGIGSYLRIITVVAMGVVGLIKFIKYFPRHKGRVPLHFSLLGIFLIIASVSIIYSIDQQITMIRAATFIAFFAFLLGLYAWLKEEEQFYRAINSLYYVILAFIVLSLIGLAVMPERVWWWNISNRLIGIWGHPNTNGIFCLTAYPVLLWKFNHTNRYGKILIVFLFIIVLLMHIMTGSRTSLFASLVGICAWFIAQKQGVKIVLSVLTISLFAFILIQINPESFEREKSKEITDVTGRDKFWDSAEILITEKPLTGYGYAVEGKVFSDPRFYVPGYALWSGSNRTSIHNGYLSIALGVGIIGILICIVLLLLPFIRGLSTSVSYYKAFAYSIMAMMLLENFAESALDSANSIGAIFFWVGWIVIGRIYEIEKLEAYEETDEIEEDIESSYAA